MIIKHEFLDFDTNFAYFTNKEPEEHIAKFLKMAYQNNKPRFVERFINFYKAYFKAYDIQNYNDILNNINKLWDVSNEFSYKESFELKNNNFRIKVFSHINIETLVKELGTTRINVEGKDVINKVWNPIKKIFEYIPTTLVYELHHANGGKLELENTILPIVKCWCTSTNNEHWLWVNPSKIINNSPLSAIASTCCIYKSMHGKIKHIIRHGDVFVFEMIEKVIPKENEEIISLNTDEYFSLLKSQS